MPLARDKARVLEIQSRRELAQVLESRKKYGEKQVWVAINKLQAQLSARET